MVRSIQILVLAMWLGWFYLFTVSTDILISKVGPRDFSQNGWGYPRNGLACTYFTALGMTTRFHDYSSDGSDGRSGCPDKLW